MPQPVIVFPKRYQLGLRAQSALARAVGPRAQANFPSRAKAITGIIAYDAYVGARLVSMPVRGVGDALVGTLRPTEAGPVLKRGALPTVLRGTGQRMTKLGAKPLAPVGRAVTLMVEESTRLAVAAGASVAVLGGAVLGVFAGIVHAAGSDHLWRPARAQARWQADEASRNLQTLESQECALFEKCQEAEQALHTLVAALPEVQLQNAVQRAQGRLHMLQTGGASKLPFVQREIEAQGAELERLQSALQQQPNLAQRIEGLETTLATLDGDEDPQWVAAQRAQLQQLRGTRSAIAKARATWARARQGLQEKIAEVRAADAELLRHVMP